MEKVNKSKLEGIQDVERMRGAMSRSSSFERDRSNEVNPLKEVREPELVTHAGRGGASAP